MNQKISPGENSEKNNKNQKEILPYDQGLLINGFP